MLFALDSRPLRLALDYDDKAVYGLQSVHPRKSLTTATELGIGKPVELVVTESELEDPGLLELDGNVGQGHAVADHAPVLGSCQKMKKNVKPST